MAFVLTRERLLAPCQNRSGPPPLLRATVAVDAARSIHRLGPMCRKDVAVSIGHDPRDGTVGNALKMLVAAAVLVKPDGSRLYMFPAQLEALEAPRRMWDLPVRFEAVGIPAPACRCSGQPYLSEDGLRCLKCGHRSLVAA